MEPAASPADTTEACGSFNATAQRKLGGWGDDGATPLTAMARALYEGGVVPVRALARLCGVSVRTLYHHAHKRGWTMRNAPPVRGGATAKARRRALRNALAPKAPRGHMSQGLAARDPQAQAAALVRTGRAQPLAAAAHAQALARHETEAAVHTLAALVQALAILHGPPAPRRKRPAVARAPAFDPRYDRSLEEMRAELLRKMNAITVEREAERSSRR